VAPVVEQSRWRNEFGQGARIVANSPCGLVKMKTS
jgi:hypothetical protein